MSKWEKVKLGEVFKITSGGTPSKSNPSYYKNGTIQWVRTGDLKEKYITKVEGLITEEAVNNSSAKKFPADTVLIAMYGATIGACSILATEAATNQACAAFLQNKEVNSSYLYYFLYSMKKDFIKMAVGGAQPNISAKILKEVEMPFPPIETQKQIAKTLDTAAELLTMREQQLVELDNLIKSIFYDMFGDPVTNEKGWEKYYVSAVYEIIDGDRGVNYPKQEEFADEGYCLFLNTGNITKYGFNFDSLKFITEEKDKQLRKGKAVRGDIIFTTRGTVGNIVHYNESIPYDVVRINSGMVLLRLLNSNISSIYFCEMFKSEEMRRELKTYLSGTAQPQLPITNMRKIKIPLPPISVQTKFAETVTQIEAQKALVKQAIDETQYLFDSLMSKYFD